MTEPVSEEFLAKYTREQFDLLLKDFPNYAITIGMHDQLFRRWVVLAIMDLSKQLRIQRDRQY